MVGHQAIGEDITAGLAFPLPEIVKVIGVIVIPGKNRLSVMTTLDDMMRTIGKDNTGVTGQMEHIRLRRESQK